MRPGVIAFLTMVPVVALIVAAGVAEAYDGRPASMSFILGQSVLGGLWFVAPCAAIAIGVCRNGNQCGAVVVALSLLAVGLGADSAINTADEAAQIIILFPIVFAPIALVAAGVGSLVGLLVRAVDAL
jgi:hypothetical protein